MHDISALELKERKDRGEQISLIDVREPYEHEEFNIGGMNLPLGEIMSWSEELPFSKDSEIIVYCRSGNRSTMAKTVMAAKGYTAVRNLTGGLLAWAKL